jgi:hypothetical protein
MLEDGKITAEDATSLLRAMEKPRPAPGTGDLGVDGRYLRIRVSDTISGAEKVDVTIPLGLVRVGLRMAERFAPDLEGFDLAELEELIADGVTGKLIEVKDAQDNEVIEISVE